MRKLSLERLMAEMPSGFTNDLVAWDRIVPVGLEIIDYGEHSGVTPEYLKALIHEGRA
jgi:hypothetical protein